MFRKIMLVVVAIALLGSVGCDLPWADNKPDSNRETHEKFLQATKELTRLKIEELELIKRAKKALAQESLAEFDGYIEMIRVNLRLQHDCTIDAEESASSPSLRKSIQRERAEIKREMDQLDDRTRVMRETREFGAWANAELK